MLANFLGVLPTYPHTSLCALAFIMCSKSNPLVVTPPSYYQKESQTQCKETDLPADPFLSHLPCSRKWHFYLIHCLGLRMRLRVNFLYSCPSIPTQFPHIWRVLLARSSKYILNLLIHTASFSPGHCCFHLNFCGCLLTVLPVCTLAPMRPVLHLTFRLQGRLCFTS
jgi:hypothetical protein